jgi:hypothetical protein
VVSPRVGDNPGEDQLERPSSACVLCRPPQDGKSWRLADQGYATCSSCAERLAEVLADIVARCSRLDPAPQRGDGGGTRGAPGFGSRSPASDHVIVMLDVRSAETAKVWVAADGRVHREPEHPTLSVFNVLNTIAYEIIDSRDLDSSPAVDGGVDGLARFIGAHLDWLTRQPVEVVDVADRLYRLQGQLKPVTGDPRIKVGRCPNTIDEGDHTSVCRGPLFATANMSLDDVIRCSACRREWRRRTGDWEKLGELLDQPEPVEEPAADEEPAA